MLTPQGERLFPLFVALRQWGERQWFAPGEPPSALIDRCSGQTVPFKAVRDAKGAVLPSSASEVRKLPTA
ncbi:hypothetical protein D0838_09005 [Bordetella avium]|uniref:hypothetical protein n=1 Tax=Bordetella avium TaxID=521 RepID=UPI00068F5EB6|nr:hypothetical protein C0J09_05685 [Bordetella avium]RIQ70877.1 hypothetical protein D0838_09005 [Bordetella avium]